MVTDSASARLTLLTSRHYFLLTLGCLAVVVYGSLVPLQYRPLPLEIAWQTFRQQLQLELIEFHSKTDWLSNILLFIPLGYCAAGMMSVDRHQEHRLTCLLLWPLLIVISAGIELLQIWFPPRVTSVNDILAESLGGLIGIILWILVGPWLTRYFREWTSIPSNNWALRLLPGYILLLIILHVMPLEITIRPTELWHKYKDGMIRLIPFNFPSQNIEEAIKKSLWNVIYFVGAGLLLGGLGRRSLARRIGFCFGLAGGIEFLQVFIQSRHADSTDVITGGLAALLGWSLMLHLGATHPGCSLPLRTALLIVWLGLITAVSWYPLQFDFSSIQTRWNQIHWLPFVDYYYGDYLNSFNEIVRKIILFVPVGLLAIDPIRPTERYDLLRVSVYGMSLAAGIEAGQLAIPERFPSISDVILGGIGTGLGCRLMTLMKSNRVMEMV